MKTENDSGSLVVIENSNTEWTSSPESGVESKRFERSGEGNSTRATSIVKFPADRQFAPHTHFGGEEFLVLDGVFSDGTGNFPQGFYVRNPVGSSHSPWSQPGAIIFAKIGQFDSRDPNYVRLDTKGADWQNYPEQGMKVLLLHQFEDECTFLVSLDSGHVFPQSGFVGGLEIFVVSGQLTVSDNDMMTHDWMRSAHEEDIRITSRERAVFYLKTGHLAADSAK